MLYICLQFVLTLIYPAFLCALVSLKTAYISRNMYGNINYTIVQYTGLFVRHT